MIVIKELVLKSFFKEQVKNGIFIDISVVQPYYIGYDINGNEMKWYADKLYRCNVCGVLWEFLYPDFPSKDFIRKFTDGKYRLKE